MGHAQQNNYPTAEVIIHRLEQVIDAVDQSKHLIEELISIGLSPYGLQRGLRDYIEYLETKTVSFRR